MKHAARNMLLTVCTALATSCSVNVPPPDLYSDPDAITNVASARSLLTSCYLVCPHYEYEFSMLGNDFCPSSLAGKDVEQQNLYNWQDKNIGKLAAEVWLAYYNTIANCDVLLERLPGVGDGEGQEKAFITAEAKTLKALCYLQLLRIYAPPYHRGAEGPGIVVKTKVGLETPARQSIAASVDYIRRLLNDAAAVTHTTTRNGWLSQNAAIYLLAELDLYAADYGSAADRALQLLGSAPEGALTAPNYGRLWETDSYEGRIFAFSTASPYYTSIEFSATEGDYFALNPALCMDEGDVRRNVSEYTLSMSGADRQLLGKYNRRNKLGQSIAYIDQLRYAGALFIAAESLARTGKEGEARQLLDDYLSAMGAPALPDSLSGDALVERILLEKAREFAGEGVNWFDLKRTGQPLPRLKKWGTATGATISATDYRWTFPIPSSEYKYNEQVVQNEGWPINR